MEVIRNYSKTFFALLLVGILGGSFSLCGMNKKRKNSGVSNDGNERQHGNETQPKKKVCVENNNSESFNPSDYTLESNSESSDYENKDLQQQQQKQQIQGKNEPQQQDTIIQEDERSVVKQQQSQQFQQNQQQQFEQNGQDESQMIENNDNDNDNPDSGICQHCITYISNNLENHINNCQQNIVVFYRNLRENKQKWKQQQIQEEDSQQQGEMIRQKNKDSERQSKQKVIVPTNPFSDDTQDQENECPLKREELMKLSREELPKKMFKINITGKYEFEYDVDKNLKDLEDFAKNLVNEFYRDYKQSDSFSFFNQQDKDDEKFFNESSLVKFINHVNEALVNVVVEEDGFESLCPKKTLLGSTYLGRYVYGPGPYSSINIMNALDNKYEDKNGYLKKYKEFLEDVLESFKNTSFSQSCSELICLKTEINPWVKYGTYGILAGGLAIGAYYNYFNTPTPTLNVCDVNTAVFNNKFAKNFAVRDCLALQNILNSFKKQEENSEKCWNKMDKNKQNIIQRDKEFCNDTFHERQQQYQTEIDTLKTDITKYVGDKNCKKAQEQLSETLSFSCYTQFKEEKDKFQEQIDTCKAQQNEEAEKQQQCENKIDPLKKDITQYVMNEDCQNAQKRLNNTNLSTECPKQFDEEKEKFQKQIYTCTAQQNEKAKKQQQYKTQINETNTNTENLTTENLTSNTDGEVDYKEAPKISLSDYYEKLPEYPNLQEQGNEYFKTQPQDIECKEQVKKLFEHILGFKSEEDSQKNPSLSTRSMERIKSRYLNAENDINDLIEKCPNVKDKAEELKKGMDDVISQQETSIVKSISNFVNSVTGNK
jgi:hypothetical protein